MSVRNERPRRLRTAERLLGLKRDLIRLVDPVLQIRLSNCAAFFLEPDKIIGRAEPARRLTAMPIDVGHFSTIGGRHGPWNCPGTGTPNRAVHHACRSAAISTAFRELTDLYRSEMYIIHYRRRRWIRMQSLNSVGRSR